MQETFGRMRFDAETVLVGASVGAKVVAQAMSASRPGPLLHDTKSPHKTGFYNAAKRLFRQFVHRCLIKLTVDGEATITLERADLRHRISSELTIRCAHVVAELI